MENTKHEILILSGKRGVGKSSIAVAFVALAVYAGLYKYLEIGDCSKATGKLLGSNLLGFAPKQLLAAKNEVQAGYTRKTLSNEKQICT